MTLIHIHPLEPLELHLGKEYKINYVKEIEASEDFLSLGQSITGCQNKESLDDCKTKVYINALSRQCQCLPFSIREKDQVLSNQPMQCIDSSNKKSFLRNFA